MQPHSTMDEDYQNEDYQKEEYQNDNVSENLSQTLEVHSESEHAETVTSDQGYGNAEQEYEYITIPDMRMRSLPETGMEAEPALFALEDDKWRALGRKPFIIFSVLLLLSLIMVTAALVLVCLRCFLGCPSEWLEFRQKCYNFTEKELKWDEARSSCQDQGADLLVIDNEKEQDFLQNKWVVRKIVWIGLSYIKNEETWMWVDRKKVSYTNWDFGAPTKVEHGGYRAECVISTSNKWSNDFCQKRLPFICEKSRRVACNLQSPFLPY